MNPRVLSTAEVNRLLRTPDARTARGRRDAALLGLMVGAGLRLHEAARLRHNDFHGAQITFAGKGGKMRTVALPAQALRLVRRQMEHSRASEYVFPGRGGGHISLKQVFNIVKQATLQAGLETWVHPHSLRHTFATILIRETSDLFLTQRVLGHASPDTTSRYYLAFSPDAAEKAADAVGRALSRRGGHSS